MILDRILERTRDDLRQAKSATPVEALYERASSASPPRDWLRVLGDDDGVAIIAECKRQSPSAGTLCDPYEPVDLALAYEAGGAAAISCLTDAPFFGGALQDLVSVRNAVSLPVLRKDFLVDPYQVWEARAAGADAVLILEGICDDSLLDALLAACDDAGLGSLVEVTGVDGLRRVHAAGARVIGVNNRDLRDFSVDPRRAMDVARSRPDGVVLVAESGVDGPSAVEEIGRSGIDAALVGTTLVRSEDPRARVAELVHAGQREAMR